MTKEANATLYQQLRAIAKSEPQLLTHFQTDLTDHDRKDLRKTQAGWQYIWGLRECGTSLIPLPKTQLDINILYNEITERSILKALKDRRDLLDGFIGEFIDSTRIVKAKLYLITCTGVNHGTVAPIEPYKARELMQPLRWSEIAKHLQSATLDQQFNKTA